MTDQELEQLTEEYIAQEHGCLGVKNRQYLIDDIIGFLEWLTKTHCIVSREKVMERYHDDKAAYDRNSGDGDYFEGYWGGRVDVYEAAFGTELFEERSEE